jgi:hypothetical protein
MRLGGYAITPQRCRLEPRLDSRAEIENRDESEVVEVCLCRHGCHGHQQQTEE